MSCIGLQAVRDSLGAGRAQRSREQAHGVAVTKPSPPVCRPALDDQGYSWPFERSGEICGLGVLGRWLLCLLLAGPRPAAVLAEEGFSAFSWSAPKGDSSHILPFAWLTAKEIEDPGTGVPRLVETLGGMPPGRRAMLTVDLLQPLARHPSDLLRDASGTPVVCIDGGGRVVPFHSPWWEHGAAQVRSTTAEWFRRFKERGGGVDYLVLDYEEDSSYRYLYHRLPDPGGPCGIDAYLEGLQADPRFASLVPSLQGRDLTEMPRLDRNDTWLVWRRVAKALAADYIEQAVFEPVREIFPGISFANYGFHAEPPGAPNRFGQHLHRYGSDRPVGTHQSPALYGWIGSQGPVALEDGTRIAATPFNALRAEVNRLRSMRRDSPAPVLPWIAYKGFAGSLLRDNDLYQELVFHVLLGGVEALLYWNPRSTAPPASERDDVLLNRLLGRVDRLCDNRRPVPLTDDPPGWTAPYLLSGVTAGGRRIWRFTPDPDRGLKPEDYIASMAPLTLIVDGESLSFPLAEVVRPTPALSAAGLWIVERDAGWPGL